MNVLVLDDVGSRLYWNGVNIGNCRVGHEPDDQENDACYYQYELRDAQPSSMSLSFLNSLIPPSL